MDGCNGAFLDMMFILLLFHYYNYVMFLFSGIILFKRDVTFLWYQSHRSLVFCGLCACLAFVVPFLSCLDEFLV